MATQQLVNKEKQQVANQQEKTRPGRYFLPDVDIYETADALKLRADMPGVAERALGLTLEDGTLTIEGKVATDIYDGWSPLYTEYNVGDYYRQFRLHESIDSDRIKASLKNGVLEVDLPKSAKARPKRIQVEAA
jgi:HSP20 family protein